MTAPVKDYQSQTEALATVTAATAANILAAYAAGHITAAEVAALIASVVSTGNTAAATLADAYVAAHIEHVTGVPTPTVGVVPPDDEVRLTRAVETILQSQGKAGVSTASREKPAEPATELQRETHTRPEPLSLPSVKSADPDPATAPKISPVEPVPRVETAEPPPGLSDSESENPDPTAMRIERLAHSEPLAAAQDATIEAIAAQPAVIGWRRHMDADPCELCKFWWAGGRIYKATTEFRSHKGCNCQPEPVIATTTPKEMTA